MPVFEVQLTHSSHLDRQSIDVFFMHFSRCLRAPCSIEFLAALWYQSQSWVFTQATPDGNINYRFHAIFLDEFPHYSLHPMDPRVIFSLIATTWWWKWTTMMMLCTSIGIGVMLKVSSLSSNNILPWVKSPLYKPITRLVVAELEPAGGLGCGWRELIHSRFTNS